MGIFFIQCQPGFVNINLQNVEYLDDGRYFIQKYCKKNISLIKKRGKIET